jgi:hypothetical protein
MHWGHAFTAFPLTYICFPLVAPDGELVDALPSVYFDLNPFVAYSAPCTLVRSTLAVQRMPQGAKSKVRFAPRLSTDEQHSFDRRRFAPHGACFVIVCFA